MIAEWLQRKVTDYAPGVGRVFVLCGGGAHQGCNRVVPYYQLYGKVGHVGCDKCGCTYFRPARIPEWKAALWVMWGFAIHGTDPRVPMRKVDSKYA